jgi:septum site-determining protein MinD
MVEKGDMLSLDDVLEILAIDLLGIVPEDERIVVTSNQGSPAVWDDKITAGLAFLNITDRILGKDVELLDIKKHQSLWEKFKQKIKNIGRKT